jgi:hypothetical protein
MIRLSALLLTLAVGAVAIDNNWDGFVHFKNWKGCVPNNDVLKRPFQGTGFPISIAKDICAIDVDCKAISKGGPAFGTFLEGGVTNTTYDMFLGIKGHASTSPAAFCTIESGGGNLPNVNWLGCENDFKFGGGLHDIEPDHILNTYSIPPDQIHSACLKNPKCVGFRIRNDASGGDILGKNANLPGWFLMPTP